MHTHIAPDGTVYEHEHIHTDGETEWNNREKRWDIYC